MSELLIGCGNDRRKRHWFDREEWTDLVTIDHDPNCGADILHDLEQTPWPLDDDRFDEVHAYEVLEHLGRQGDYSAFFAHFGEIYRILKPGGTVFATCPSWQSIWAWGDPSHTRIISQASIAFLNREAYEKQVGRTPMTDFRWLWKGDFEPLHVEDNGSKFVFAMKAHKPARY